MEAANRFASTIEVGLTFATQAEDRWASSANWRLAFSVRRLSAILDLAPARRHQIRKLSGLMLGFHLPESALLSDTLSVPSTDGLEGYNTALDRLMHVNQKV